MISLIVSLGFTGLLPQMTVGAASGVRAAVPEQPTKCCCGTEDGRCCGMGCCIAQQPPAKESCPYPNRKDTRDGQNNLQARTLAQKLFSDDGEKPGSRFGHT